MQVPEEEKYLNSKAELEAIIIGLLGGRAAEELKFESVTTGASNDIERATALARNMVTQYGMSERFGLMGLATVESQYLEGRAVLNCSDVTAAAVDEEVRKILETSYREAKRILSENMDAMDVIADFLIKQETITGKEFMKMFNDVRAKRDGGQGETAEEQTASEEDAASEEETGAASEVQQIAAEEAVSDTAEIPVAEIVSAIEERTAAEDVSAAEEAPAAAEIPAAEIVSAAEDISAAENVPAAEAASEAEDRPAAEEVRPENETAPVSSSPKGRFSQVSLDDLFGEK